MNKLEIYAAPAASILTLLGFIFFVPGKDLSTENKTLPAPHISIQPQLTEESYLRGLTHQHKQRSDTISGIDETLGPGICIVDINNDTYMDIFAVPGSGYNHLFGNKSWWQINATHHTYINDGSGHFSVAAAETDLSDL